MAMLNNQRVIKKHRFFNFGHHYRVSYCDRALDTYGHLWIGNVVLPK